MQKPGRVLLVFGLLLGVLVAPSGGSAAQDENELQPGMQTLEHEGLERTYLLHVPASYISDEPVPLVIALHPAGSSSTAMAILTGLNDFADQHNFIVVYPDTVLSTWAEGLDTVNPASDGETVNDVDFIRVLIDTLSTDYAIDSDRIFLVGQANGGLMAYRAACMMPALFAGVAVVGPLMWEYHRDFCADESTPPINLFIMHGHNDYFYWTETRGYVPAVSGGQYIILGRDDTLAVWTDRNGCADEPTLATVNLHVYSNCEGDTTTAYYGVVNGGYNWYRPGDYTLNNVGLDTSAMVVSFFMGTEDWQTPQPQPVIRQARSYSVYVPPTYDPTQPTPLVMVLHGRPSQGETAAELTQMSQIAAEQGFIVVYPDGLNGGWNYGRRIAGYPTYPDDVEFLTTLIDDLGVDLAIDRERVYVTGFSNGGFMVQRLACEAPLAFTAFATVMSPGFEQMHIVCVGQPPVALLMIHGTADTVNPWDGLTFRDEGREVYTVLPMNDTLNFWLAHNDCGEDIRTEDLPILGNSPGTSVRMVEATGCARNTALRVYAVLGGGHTWPGVDWGFDSLGATNMDFNAGEAIWEFFSQFPTIQSF